MIKVVVDTNIVFSAILNSSGKIGKVLLNSRNIFHFVSCRYMQTEIDRHLNKLQTLTGLEPGELDVLIKLITARINLINEEFISRDSLLKAEELTRDVDFDDLLFVALTLELKSRLWTGDKKLIRGIGKKGFSQIVTTSELSEILDHIGKQI
jgi:predicted nucleic acid-binding protein